MTAMIECFFDPSTNTITHLIYDHVGGHAAVIDPVLDFDLKTERTSTVSADKIISFIHEKKLTLSWILETHAHADHLTSAKYFQQLLGGKIAIGAHIGEVQSTFKEKFNLEENFAVDGSQFDVLLDDDQVFHIGQLQVSTIFVPGHTPADIAYKIDNAVFIGDTLFAPDIGTARCDFPGGDAAQLFQSIQKILSLPPATNLFLCHDYPPTSRQYISMTTVAEQRAKNIHAHDGISAAQFVNMRENRDASLAAPILMVPAVQRNIRAGSLPFEEGDGDPHPKSSIKT